MLEFVLSTKTDILAVGLCVRARGAGTHAQTGPALYVPQRASICVRQPIGRAPRAHPGFSRDNQRAGASHNASGLFLAAAERVSQGFRVRSLQRSRCGHAGRCGDSQYGRCSDCAARCGVHQRLLEAARGAAGTTREHITQIIGQDIESSNGTYVNVTRISNTSLSARYVAAQREAYSRRPLRTTAPCQADDSCVHTPAFDVIAGGGTRILHRPIAARIVRGFTKGKAHSAGLACACSIGG